LQEEYLTWKSTNINLSGQIDLIINVELNRFAESSLPGSLFA
jgi:hypothetical protein